ncbi:MAG: hypothetical protein CMQ20_05165 [Gammaproteobacteria bacterium]|jgi:hypothetical protein|nr:hypothetical protein [Gammaproteobacteria bacterium]|tara:strand:+ start:9331 stop:9648 length:318 start_codon:yes stop_codon:yes gene_type:complete
MFFRNFQIVALLGLVAMTTGCVSSPSQQIVGAWQSELGGFPVLVKYTNETVSIGEYEAVSYQVEEGKLILAQEGSQPRTLSFPSANEMIQTDTLTGTEHKFTRVK